MGNVRSHPARELRRRRREWARTHGRVLLFVAVLFVAAGAVVTIGLLPLLSQPASFYVLGALHVGLVALWLRLMNATFLAHQREAVWRLRGAWGEDNTRDELGRHNSGA